MNKKKKKKKILDYLIVFAKIIMLQYLWLPTTMRMRIVSACVSINARAIEPRFHSYWKVTMGNPISKIRAEAKAADDKTKHEMEQRLQILEKMVDGRLQNVTTEILTGSRNDQEIDTGTIVEIHKQINITQSSKESQKIGEAIHDFFSGNWMGGLEKIVALGAEAILGNDSMGEYETTDMFIVWTNNALLRCDAYYYRWNFVSKGVIDGAEGVVGVLLVKRVVDLTKTDPQVLTWAITKQAVKQGLAGDKIDGMIDSAMKVIRKVVSLQSGVRALEVAGSAGTTEGSHTEEVAAAEAG